MQVDRLANQTRYHYLNKPFTKCTTYSQRAINGLTVVKQSTAWKVDRQNAYTDAMRNKGKLHSFNDGSLRVINVWNLGLLRVRIFKYSWNQKQSACVA